LTVTGGELSYGLLASNTSALVTVYGGSGADVFDLTASMWTATELAGVTINGNFATNTPNTTGTNFFVNSDDAPAYVTASGGAGTGTVVELNCTEIGTISAIATDAFGGGWSNVPTLYDVAVGSGLGTVSGNINMADFPGTGIVTLANTHSGNYVDAGNISVTNAPNDFIFNFQDVQSAGNFAIVGVGGVGDTATINYGTGYLSTDPVDGSESFSTQGIDNVIVNVFGESGLTLSTNPVYLKGIVAVANSTGAEVLTIDSNVGLQLANDGTNAVVSHDTLSLFGGVESTTVLPPFITSWTETGTLDLTGTGFIWLGVTNASTIDSSGGGQFWMGPDDAIDYGTNAGTASANIVGDVVTANGGDDIVQGTLDHNRTGNDVLTDLSGDTVFLGDGGSDQIFMGQGNGLDNEVYFGIYSINNTNKDMQIGGAGFANAGFWGNNNSGGPQSIATMAAGTANGWSSDLIHTAGTGFDITQVNGFALGTTDDDQLWFNPNSWDHGSGNGALVTGGLTDVSASLTTVGFTSTQNGSLTGGQLTATTNFLLYSTLGTVPDAASLAADLSGPAGYIEFTTPTTSGTQYHMLVAFGDGSNIHIADVDFIGNGSASTQGMTIYASDMVELMGQSSLLTLGTHVADIVYHLV
jgi:hypothetical protein